MTIREIAIAKLQQLPESLLPEVSEFIDFVMHKHQNRIKVLPLILQSAKADFVCVEAVSTAES